jgi:hypothetical protein
MPSRAHSQAPTDVKIAGKRVAVNVITVRGVREPRLRFDKVAVGLVRRLQQAIATSVPNGQVVMLSITAPIRQDSKTGAILEQEIPKLLAAGQTQLELTIHTNRIRIHVLQGGTRQTPKLIGFVHNPEPDPAILFEVARSLLACMAPVKTPAKGERGLIVVGQDGTAPFETVRQVCLALGAESVFNWILLAESAGVRLVQ